jgi:hypothetical protein
MLIKKMPKVPFGVSSQIAGPLSRDFFSPLNRWGKIQDFFFLLKTHME